MFIHGVVLETVSFSALDRLEACPTAKGRFEAIRPLATQPRKPESRPFLKPFPDLPQAFTGDDEFKTRVKNQFALAGISRPPKVCFDAVYQYL